MAGSIFHQVEALEALDLEGLRAEWRRRWGDPPALRSRELMAHAAAHRLQVEAFGDLDAPTRRRLAELGRRFSANRAFRPTAGPELKPGCSVIREWGGSRHEVKVLDEGFGYNGEVFASLSRIAEHITGTKRSGLLFFGLKPKAGDQ
jgi:Protein of unknown function (DUF2924)